MDAPHFLASSFRALLLDRQRLVLENLVLRQQLAVLRRSVNRPKLEDKDHIFWIGLMRLLSTWRETLLIVKPETVIKWHRKGWKAYWRRKSKPAKVGRPKIGWTLVHLIKRLSRENPLWGAPRIAQELVVLGHEVAETTVARSMVRHRPPERGQSWSTFLSNPKDTTIACDFFTVPTVMFRSLFVFVVLHHKTRRILQVGVTQHPTAEWTAQQLVQALGPEAPKATYLIRDRDSIYGEAFQGKAKALGLEQVITPRRSPWCNGFAERVIGTLRRECTDHIIPLNEHLEPRARGVRGVLQRGAMPPGIGRGRAVEPAPMDGRRRRRAVDAGARRPASRLQPRCLTALGTCRCGPCSVLGSAGCRFDAVLRPT